MNYRERKFEIDNGANRRLNLRFPAVYAGRGGSASDGYDCNCIVNHPTHIGIVVVFELNRETIGAVPGNHAGQLEWSRRFEGARRFEVNVEFDARADFRPHRCVFDQGAGV